MTPPNRLISAAKSPAGAAVRQGIRLVPDIVGRVLRGARARARRAIGHVYEACAAWNKARYHQTFVRHRLASALGRAPAPRYDLVLIAPPRDSSGWILDATCREIARYYPGSSRIVHFPEFPPARCYYFSHYFFMIRAMKSQPSVWGVPRVAQFTHPAENGVSQSELVYALNSSTQILSNCSLFAQQLIAQGVDPTRVTTSLLGADPQRFTPHRRGEGAIGFSMAYYPRKDPDRVLAIVQAMPHRRFILLGRRWEQYPRFDDMRRLSNLDYRELHYDAYPDAYREMDVLVSTSRLEGGPIPLIEAMMCNVVPVASRTGFAPDLINHGDNGFVFEVDAPIDRICELIEQASALKNDVRPSVEHLTWERFSRLAQQFLYVPGTANTSLG